MPNSAAGIATSRAETQLLLAVAQGDREAFARLFALTAPKVKGYLLRLGCAPNIAEELTQDVMLTVWRRAGQYDPAKSGPLTWLFVVARNRRIDWLRRERAEVLYEFEQSEDEAPRADQQIIGAEQEGRVREALGDLPNEQREVLRRAFFEEEAHATIAAALNLPLGTVKSRIRLAMAKLRTRLEDMT
jgi:RNA polymerase sigma-70 factor (ECF subfamily)